MIQIIQHDYDLDQPLNVERHSVDLVFADPPYNQGVKYADDPTQDAMPGYREMVGKAMYHLAAAMRDGGTLWWLCPIDQIDWIGRQLTEIVGPREYVICWNERFSQYQSKRLTADFRLLFCHRVRGGAVTFNPDEIREESERLKRGDRRANPAGRIPGTTWLVRRLQGTANDRVDWHPTQLPPEPLERIVRGWTNPGDTVLDGFAGSGSMGLVASRLGRRFIGVDRSPSYCSLLRERLKVPAAYPT